MLLDSALLHACTVPQTRNRYTTPIIIKYSNSIFKFSKPTWAKKKHCSISSIKKKFTPNGKRIFITCEFETTSVKIIRDVKFYIKIGVFNFRLLSTSFSFSVWLAAKPIIHLLHYFSHLIERDLITIDIINLRLLHDRNK